MEASFQTGNAGDLLNQFLLKKLFPAAILNPIHDGRFPKLACIGSVIENLSDGDVVYGAGLRDPDGLATVPKDIRVFGLRGPMSLKLLEKKGIDVSSLEFLLDPGVVASKIFSSGTSESRWSRNEILYIPHFQQRRQYRGLGVKARFFEIDCHAEDLLKSIYVSRGVLTSSLHALMLAHAFGVPAVLFRSPDKLFKYHDYAESVGWKLNVFDDPREVNYADFPTTPFEIDEYKTLGFNLNDQRLYDWGVAN